MNYIWGVMILLGVTWGTLTGNTEAVSEAALSSAREAVTLCITMLGVMGLWMGLMEIAKDAGLIQAVSRKIQPLIRFLFPEIPDGHPAGVQITLNCVANFLGLGWAATPAGLKAMESLAELEEERRKQSEGSKGANVVSGRIKTGRKEPADWQRSTDSGAAFNASRQYPGQTEKNPDRNTKRNRKGCALAMPRGVASNEMCTFLILNISSLQLIPVNVIAYRSQYGSVNPTAIVGPGIMATAVSTAVAVVFCKVMDRKRRE